MTLSNEELQEPDLPPQNADWKMIEEFALTFDGYGHWGSFEKCAEIANSRKASTLTELGTCLFFEQRRWRHSGDEPEGEALADIRGLVEKIRLRLRETQVDCGPPGAA